MADRPNPNLSRAQKQVLTTPGVTWVGWDFRNRPVAAQKRRFSDTVDEWAVKRDGEPADIIPPVRPV